MFGAATANCSARWPTITAATQPLGNAGGRRMRVTSASLRWCQRPAAAVRQSRRRGIVRPSDELGRLAMQDKANETLLTRLAQMGRAAGIHMILATQRPDANTFSGTLRTNCPARIALRASRVSESKIIMDEPGAERLQGAGDMILRATGFWSAPTPTTFAAKTHGTATVTLCQSAIKKPAACRFLLLF